MSDFYNKCRNLQYFKYLVTVPSLPDTPPNFLVASELSNHVTPVATMVPDTDTLVDDTIDDSASELNTVNDERERYIDQLLAEVESLQVTTLLHCQYFIGSIYNDAGQSCNVGTSIQDPSL